MKSNTECLLDENGFELTVHYRYEETPEYYEEPGNTGTLVAGMVYTEIDYVELEVGKKGINILPLLDERQVEWLKKQLNYE